MNKKWDVFLTHDWGYDQNNVSNHDRVSLINKILKKLGYRTWFDEDRMTGNIVDQMCHGIKNSTIILVFITKRYSDKVGGDDGNDNCKKVCARPKRLFVSKCNFSPMEANPAKPKWIH